MCRRLGPMPSAPHTVAAALMAALLLAGSPAAGDDTLVLGGLSAGGYVYSGSPEANLLNDGAAHDARLRVGGLAGHELRRRWLELRTALFAGAIVAARTSAFRQPAAEAGVELAWRPAHGVELELELEGTIEPLTSSRSAASSGVQALGEEIEGSPLLDLRPLARLTIELGHRDELTPAVRAHHFVLLRDRSRFEPGSDDVSVANHVEGALSWSHQLAREHRLVLRGSGSGMGAATQFAPPRGYLVGGSAGYGLSHRGRLYLLVLAGATRAVGGRRDHLWAVEPTLRLEAEWTNRLDRVQLTANMGLRQNVYIGGLPERTINARVAWERAPSHRRLRWSLALGHDYARYLYQSELGPIVDELHMLRGVGRVYVSLGSGLRLFTRAEATWASMRQGRPMGTPDSGLQLLGMVGLAYLYLDRPRDERLIAGVW